MVKQTFNNEYFQVIRQGFEFSFKDHIYEKNNKYYIYNNQTLEFDVISDKLKCEIEQYCIIGEEEKCKTCDLNQPKFCGSCNDGFYLNENNKMICKECSTSKCKACPNDICLQCLSDIYEIR